MARIRPARRALLREHLKAESDHDMAALLDGFTEDCFNDIACLPKRFVGPKRVAERYRAHWRGFPDFKVRIRRVLAADANRVVTENQWTGTHLGPFQGIPATGRRVRVRSLVVWHFRGDRLWGETVFFDVGSILKQIGAEVVVRRRRKRRGKAGTRRRRAR